MFGFNDKVDTVAFKPLAEGYRKVVLLRNSGAALRVVDYRAYNLNSFSLIEDAALDKYECVRDAYLQRREGKIYKGDAPKQDANGPAPANSADGAHNMPS